MTLTHQTNARNAAADAVVDLIDAGTGAGHCKLYEGGVGATLIADITVQNPAFGAAAGGEASLQGAPSNSAAASTQNAGVDAFAIEDGDGTEIFRGTVGESYSVTALSGKTISVSDASNTLTGRLSAADQVRITGNSNSTNNITYTVVSVSHNSGTTTITVVESIPDDTTVDGSFVPGEMEIQNRNVNSGQTVTINSATYAAPE